MMHPMKSPQDWNSVIHEVLQIDCKIQDKNGCEYLYPRRQRHLAQQTPFPLLGVDGQCDRGCRQNQSQEHLVEYGCRNIARPAAAPGNHASTTREHRLKRSERGKHAKKTPQADDRFG